MIARAVIKEAKQFENHKSFVVVAELKSCTCTQV